MLQIVVSSLVELTILEIFGLQEVLGGFIMETITLSNQGATVPDLGMPISFWTSVCALKSIYSLWLDLDVMLLWLKTMYVAVVLYGYLCLSGDVRLDTTHCLCLYMLLAMRKP